VIIILLNIVGTVYHLFQRLERTEKKHQLKWIEYFSLERNVTKLFTVKPNNLDVFAGIRVLMIFYVIYAHVYLVYLQAFRNMAVFFTIFEQKMLIVVNSGFYAVDTFFFMGGFFSAYVLSKKLAK
jgi:acyl-ACP thioesterase